MCTDLHRPGSCNAPCLLVLHIYFMHRCFDLALHGVAWLGTRLSFDVIDLHALEEITTVCMQIH